MFLKDANAKHLMENGPEFDDEDEEQNDKYRKKSYFEEQEAVRNEFLDAVADEDDDDGELLKVKNDNNGDEDEDDREYEKKLDEYFKEDDKLDESEKILKDYFRKKMWLEKDNGNGKVLYDDEIDVSEDEEELEKQEDYERGFNFRYEENAGDRVMGHSRKVDGSKEINEKLRKIRETAGIGENGGFLLEDHDLEEEFDPEEYDKKMKKAFDDSFYEADDVDPGFGSDDEDGELEKPNFDEEDELLGLPKGWDDEYGSGAGKKSKHDVGQTETGKSKSDAENEDQKELSRKQRRKMRLNELKISTKRRMAYEGSTTKSNKKRKHKSKDAV
ncbi:hypothetical protein L1987_57445 [Smallanthus sonchifolius]|uniref:Uncharacterized protein n=1 Tax=Smallanthus sonchifolius TaxID=185202 RepID=A0ACB9DD21_9ASTR|nr:hypothetical protein L1987_57445 [Smallanthus sonchifolius]